MYMYTTSNNSANKHPLNNLFTAVNENKKYKKKYLWINADSNVSFLYTGSAMTKIW